MSIKLISCIGLDYDRPLLSHFLKHYRALDIDSIHLIIHKKSKFNIQEIYDEFGDDLILEKWVGLFDGVTKTSKLNKIIENTEEDYIMMADVDEHQIWDTPVNEYLNVSNFRWGKLIDRESKEKQLIEVTDTPLDEQFPLVTNRTIWTDLFKPCLFPSTDRLASPHHLIINHNNNKDIIDIHHYRWVAGRLEKTKERKDHYTELNKTGYHLEKSPWKTIPNWEGDYILRMYKPGKLI